MSVIVKGRLRENFDEVCVDNINNHSSVIVNGRLLERKLFNNHASATNKSDFVSCEIDKLLMSGSLVEVGEHDISVSSPLSVAKYSSGKPRLILDLYFINSHLRVPKFKYEDIRTASELFQQGDWFFKFDYTSDYQPIEIFPAHTQFLGCAWVIDGQQKYFQFTSFAIWISKHSFSVHKSSESPR